MKPIHLAVVAVALAATGAVSAETATYPSSLFSARVQNALHRHRDVVEAAVADSAYGQALLARYDSGQAGPADITDAWWRLDYGDDRSPSLADAEIFKGSHRSDGEQDAQLEPRPKSEPDLMTMQVVSEEMAPVPEPDTWAMLLGGLAVLGAVARRRRRIF